MKSYFPNPIRTLVAVDGTVNNWRWLRKLKEYINLDNCRITLIAVVKSPIEKAKGKKILDLSLSLMEQEDILYMHEDSIVKVGDPTKKILEFAYDENFDLIVVGSHNKTAVENFFMGSVSSNIVTQAPIPVLVMKMGL